ncbi:MAG: two-component regulator propeller domain-containing protein, partial [Bacteroidota bacterium]
MKLPARPVSILSHLPATWGLLFFVFLNLLFPVSDYAQSLRFKHWSTDDGLSNNWVSDVLHDSRGFIWIATQWGVNKFDGHEFKLYRYNPNDANSLSSNWVRSMAEDADGNLWFGMYPGGLTRFNPFTEKFTHFVFDKNKEHSLPGNEVFKVFAGQGNRIWVATSAGAAWLQAGDTVFHRVSEKPVFDLREEERNGMWLATEDGLFSWKEGEFEAVPLLEGVPVYSISPVKNEREKIWLFTERGLQLLENQADKYKLSEPVMPADLNPNRWFFPPVLADSQGRIWAATSQGLFSDKEKNAFESWRPSSPPALAQRLHSITEDREGNIWLGTGKGIFLVMAGSEKIQAAAEMASLSAIPNVREVLQWKDEI